MTETTLVPKLSRSRTAEWWGCNRNVPGFSCLRYPSHVARDGANG